MNKKTLSNLFLVTLASTFVLSGCTRLTTSQRVGLISEAYIAANNTMTVAADNGKVRMHSGL